MNWYKFTSFRGGIADYSNTGIQGSFKMGRSLDVRKKVDSLTCQQALVDEVGVTWANLQNFFVLSNNGYLYSFGRSGNIYKRDPTAKTWSLVYTDPDGAILGASEWYHQNGKAYLFWATATKLHAKELPGNGVEPWTDVDASIVVNGTTYTYPKTNLTSSKWHTMRQALGDLIICNGSVLAFVGYDGSYTNNALNMFSNNISTCIVERDAYMVIGTYKINNGADANAFTWEPTALSYLKKKSIPTNGINAMIDTEVPLIQGGTKGGIYYSDMVSTLLVKSFPGGGQVNPDGVTNDDGMALFGVWGNGVGNTGIYSYGRKNKNSPFIMNLEYPFDCDEIGSVTKVSSDIIFSYKNGSSYGVKRVDTTLKATGTYESLELEAPLTFINPLHWKLVILTVSLMPTGCALELRYRVNRITTSTTNAAGQISDANGWFQAQLQNGSTQYTGSDDMKAIFETGAEGKVFELQIKLIPSGNTCPEVLKAEIGFT